MNIHNRIVLYTKAHKINTCTPRPFSVAITIVESNTLTLMYVYTCLVVILRC